MKNSILITTFYIALVFVVASCSKKHTNIDEKFAKVKFISAQKQVDGSVTVKGQVISAGKAPVYYTGFYFDTTAGVNIYPNQKVVTPDSTGMFQFTYPNTFDPMRKYYFGAWAANAYGYSTSAQTELSNINFDTSIIPCSPVTGKFQWLDTHPRSSDVSIRLTKGTYECKVEVFTSDTRMVMRFNKLPYNGIYRMNRLSELSDDEVYITFGQFAVDDTGKVYTRQISEHIVEVTICPTLAYDSVYHLTDNTFSTRFQFDDRY